MTASAHIYLSGPATAPNDSTALSQLTFSDLSLNELIDFTPDDLNSLLNESDSEYLGFLEPSVALNPRFFQFLNDLELADQPGIILVPFHEASPAVGTWETVPPLAAALAANPLELAAVLIRKSELQKLKTLDASQHLLWQAVILLVQAGTAVRVIKTGLPQEGSSIPETLPVLAPEYPDSDRNWLLQLLRAYEPAQDLPLITSKADATALKAGLFCIHDYLDESHDYSQSVQNRGVHVAGDYWHHIMHRREPDYSNAKYWSRAVGYHPLHDQLPAVVASLFEQEGSEIVEQWKSRLLQNDRWSLNTFVDCCAEAERSGNPELNAFAQSIQWIEMQLLLQQTSRDAATS